MVSLYELTALVVAVIAGIVAWVTSKDSSTKAYTALLVLMVGACLTMIASVRFEQLPILERSITLASRNPKAESLVRDYLKASDLVERSQDPFLPQYFNEQVRLFQDMLANAQAGRYRVDKNDLGVFANRVIDVAKKSVVATSYVSSAEWWDTSWGRQYEALNYEKVKQGVKITRYFLFSNEEERVKATPMLRRQVQNKVAVYIVNLRDAADVYWNDVIVIDDFIGGELLLTPEKTVRHVVMYTGVDDLRRLRATIEGLKVRSTPATSYPTDSQR